MDKYQEKLLRNTKIVLLTENYENKVELDGDKIVLQQSENYTLEKYNLVFENPQIELIEIDSDNDTNYKSNDNAINIPFNISKPMKKLTIHFANELADALEIQVIMKYADKEQWNEKVSAENERNMKEQMSLTCRTGYNLLNVFWINISKAVVKTQLEVYAVEDNKELLMIENVFDKETLYYALDKMAYGEYKVVLKQFDENNKIIVEDARNVEIVNDLLNKISLMSKELKNELSDVKKQVRSSGRNTVYYGN
ncbi:MAG: hypothetical protein PHF05_08045 [Candidatus Izemoplasmatales bacterium]|jgi:hypothetical protein|nr:hypothetical protein [Candidatus Izemoplasmatales bacterium]MDY0139506.1 hypothetical protein [Candidatus Izemoplasmatales bacterium]